MTRSGRRLVPLLAGLGCGGVIAVLVAFTGPLAHPPGSNQAVPSVDADPIPVAAAQPAPGQLAPGQLAQDSSAQLAPAQYPPAPALAPAPALPLIPGPPPPPHHDRPQARLSGAGAQVLALTNAQRIRAGCRPLRVDTRLTRAAQQHSADMARRGYFSHTDPSGRTWQTRETGSGFSADRTGGENIARGPSDARTVMNGWMHSPPHRRNILDCNFTTIGVGYASDGDYWTQDFGY